MSAVVGCAPVNAEAAIEALRGHLAGLRAVIAALPPAHYTAVPSAVSGSIGAHVRHCVDHVRAVLQHRPGGEVSYDARMRGTSIECDPWEAIAEIDALCGALCGLDASRLDADVFLRAVTSRGADAVTVRTTPAREIAFVIQHTVHHAAVIALLLERLGVRVPPDFGYAPSTPRPF